MCPFPAVARRMILQTGFSPRASAAAGGGGPGLAGLGTARPTLAARPRVGRCVLTPPRTPNGSRPKARVREARVRLGRRAFPFLRAKTPGREGKTKRELQNLNKS